jgi:hypothetical protein
MPLQFRRGDDADRTSITPLSGEPLWIEDTQELYIGDGSTAGGVLITGGGGGGDVATDTIWNAKGDLAVGTGSDTAQRLAVGTNDQFLVAASGQTTGLQWRGITETDLPLTTLTGVIATPEAITFDQTHSQTAAVGKLQWDDDAGTLSLGLKGGNVQLKVGETQFVRVKNNTASQIDAYKVVYLTGATGDTPNIALADADSESTSADTLGFTVENIAASGSGFVVIAGTVKGFNTSGMSLGATVYLSGTAGGFTTTAPTAPSHRVTLGYVAKAAAAPDGIIYVKVDNGYELDELHNVDITSVDNNHFLVYNSSTSRWENETPATARTSLGLGTAATSNTGDFAAASHTHGNITNAGAIGTTSGLPVKTGTSGVLEAGAFGTSAGQFAEGNHVHGNITNAGAIGSTQGLVVRTGASGVLTTLAMGTAGQVLKVNSGATDIEWGTDNTGGSGGGTKTYAFFTPLDNQPPASNFATLDTRNTTSPVAILDFDAATDESAIFVGVMPEAAVLTSGLKVFIHWAATSATSGACRWGAQIERLEAHDIDGDGFDTAGTNGTTTNATSGVVNETEITVSNIDSLAAGEPYRLKIYRDADGTSGTDDMTGDAELIAVEVRSGA